MNFVFFVVVVNDLVLSQKVFLPVNHIGRYTSRVDNCKVSAAIDIAEGNHFLRNSIHSPNCILISISLIYTYSAVPT